MTYTIETHPPPCSWCGRVLHSDDLVRGYCCGCGQTVEVGVLNEVRNGTA